MEKLIQKEIVQITCAPEGLVAIYEQENGKDLAVPVVAFAIVDAIENGDTYRYTESMIIDVETGSLEFASFSKDFVGVYFQ